MAKCKIILQPVVAVFKALGDEHRLRALLALQEQELCVCQIVELLGLAPSTVSKHMSILKQAGLVESVKHGRWVHYRLSGNLAAADIRLAVEWGINELENGDISLALKRDEIVRRDREKLKEILNMDPEELCRKQGVC